MSLDPKEMTYDFDDVDEKSPRLFERRGRRIDHRLRILSIAQPKRRFRCANAGTYVRS